MKTKLSKALALFLALVLTLTMVACSNNVEQPDPDVSDKAASSQTPDTPDTPAEPTPEPTEAPAEPTEAPAEPTKAPVVENPDSGDFATVAFVALAITAAGVLLVSMKKREA